MDNEELFTNWLETHRSVFQDPENWWYLQNCLGTMGILSFEELQRIKEKYA